MVYHREDIAGQFEYEMLLSEFDSDKESLDAWLYKLIKQFEYEYNTRHTN